LTIPDTAATLAAPIRQPEMDARMSDRFARYPSLAGKVVYVTGGASGIGAEIVTAFADQGAKVGFVDLDAEGSVALCAAHPNVTHEICDLRDIASLRAAFSALKSRIGPADVLVNNAARDDRHSWTEVTPEYWDERMDTNLRHQFFATQAVAPDMIERGGGSIIKPMQRPRPPCMG